MRVLATYVLLTIVSAPALAEWYASYEKGMDAVRTQQWESVIRFMTDAINEKDEEKANAKTYGLRFIDYFPYVYRGAAYYELGQYQKSIDDLQRSQQIGEVRDAAKDEEAELLLGRYLQLANAKLGPNARLEEEFKTAVAIYDQGDYARAKTAFERIPLSSTTEDQW